MNPRTPFTLTVPVGPADQALGPPHAPVTLVEYGDFECPNSKQAATALKLLLEDQSGAIEETIVAPVTGKMRLKKGRMRAKSFI